MEHIEDCLSFYLSKAYQRVTQTVKQRLAPYGVTPVQYALLKVLWEEDNQSGADLGERLLLDSATMTGLLDRLEHAGLIERHSHASDRRVHRIGVCGAMEQKSGLGENGVKSRRCVYFSHLLLFSARKTSFTALRQVDLVSAMGDVDL